ncbi:LytTR family DNA-binding domain-containing protein [Azospirillum isscasi]|uniref:LytTR family DNA-binding domain-containing protein n=1 Tax=Azospirillum isscasi TaxID=3053926 RepID=A0ABU0WMI6_9PROT|nr:LytTR family DNA-binding domain-containing protein [Azospirillum isscasi]MDQ2105037.1 LytTR family DNA-binding domain-containing protein [Azospirillum isscasi]
MREATEMPTAALSTTALPTAALPTVGQPRTPYLRRLLGRRLPVLLGASLVLALLGPFGTFADLTLAQRLAYWGGLIGLGSLTFELLTLAATRLLRQRAAGWRAMLGGVLLAVAVLMTLTVALLERTLRGMDLLHPLGLAELFVYVVLVTLLTSAAPIWLELRDRGLLTAPAPLPSPPPPPPPDDAAATSGDPREPAFLARLPARLGRDLLALEMEDHYVRVHTAEGSDLILMRLRDAIAELAGLDGMQVHRSHWVAAAAVAGVERKPDGKLVLTLRNGLRVPVSRSHTAAVRAAGWAGKAGP